MAHVHDYINMPFLEKYHMFLANACLSIFALISGFLFPSFYGDSKHDIYLFIVKRIKRIYILYLPTLVIFFIVFNHEQKDIVLFVQHVLSLQLLTSDMREPYWTLWYIGLIVPLIIVHGFLSFLSTKIVVNSDTGGVMAVSIMYILLYIFIGFLGQDWGVDLRVTQYLPAFILGWMLNKHNKEKSLIIMILIVVVVKLYQGALMDSTLISTIKSLLRSEFIIVFPYLLLKIAEKLVVNNKVIKLIEYASFSSFTVYLIHRPFLEGAMYLSNLTDNNNTFHSLIVVLSMFILFPISFFIQKLSNRLK